MYVAITVLIFLAAILLILIVLVQNSKGGGLASGFSASNQVMGVRKTTDFLEKATWTLAGVVVVLSIATAAFSVSADEVKSKQSMIKEEVQEATQVNPNVVQPNFGEQAPAAQQQAPAQTPAPAEKK